MKAKEKKSQIMDDVEETDPKGTTKGSDKNAAKDAKKDSAKGSNGYSAAQLSRLEDREAPVQPEVNPNGASDVISRTRQRFRAKTPAANR